MSKDLLKSVFNDIYTRVYGVGYNFGNAKVESQIDAFLGKIDFTISEEWLYDFTLFQFQYYKGMKGRFDRVYVNWIYGQAALTRYKNRTPEQIYYTNQYKQDLGVRTTEFSPINVSEHEDRERRRFDEMSRQFIHCHENVLFDTVKCRFCQLYDICNEGKL